MRLRRFFASLGFVAALFGPVCGGPELLAAPSTVAIRSTSRMAGIGDSLVGTTYNTYTNIYTAALTYYRGGSSFRNPFLNGGTQADPLTPTWLNKGVNNNTTADVDARVVADIVNVSPQPNFVIVAVGVNDVPGIAGNAAFQTSYSSILTKLTNGGIAAANIIAVSVICKGEQVGFAQGDTYAVDIAEKNSIIAALCVSFGCVYANIRSYQQTWEAVNNQANDNDGHMTVDGIHPNATGKTLISGSSTGWMWNYITLTPLSQGASVDVPNDYWVTREWPVDSLSDLYGWANLDGPWLPTMPRAEAN